MVVWGQDQKVSAQRGPFETNGSWLAAQMDASCASS